MGSQVTSKISLQLPIGPSCGVELPQLPKTFLHFTYTYPQSPTIPEQILYFIIPVYRIPLTLTKISLMLQSLLQVVLVWVLGT